MNLFYDRKYDCAPGAVANHFYRPKLDFPSPHTMALDTVPSGARVLDVGCAGGYMGEALKTKGCRVVGIDQFPLEGGVELDGVIQHDLNAGMPPLDLAEFDYVRLLEQAGFAVVSAKGAPVPIPLALGDTGLARLLLRVNQLLIRVWPQLFAFQSFMIVRPLPSLPYLLQRAHATSRERVDSVAAE